MVQEMRFLQSWAMILLLLKISLLVKTENMGGGLSSLGETGDVIRVF